MNESPRCKRTRYRFENGYFIRPKGRGIKPKLKLNIQLLNLIYPTIVIA